MYINDNFKIRRIAVRSMQVFFVSIFAHEAYFTPIPRSKKVLFVYFVIFIALCKAFIYIYDKKVS
jgi:hypothetical protein